MSTIINISSSTLFSLGSTSSMSADDNNNLGSTGTILTASATTVSVAGNQMIQINVNAAELHDTKAYVESLSDDQLAELSALLDERQVVLDTNEIQEIAEGKQPYSKK